MLLYKYRPWNNFAEQILTSNSIFYPTKDNLNDLAELIHPIKFENNKFDIFKIKTSIEKGEGHRKSLITSSNINEIFRKIETGTCDKEQKSKFEKYLTITDKYQRVVEATYDQIENINDAFFYYTVNQFEDARLLYCSYEVAVDRLNDKLSKFGILSLSSKSNCPVMWAHYAANHTGVIFIFDSTKDDLLSIAEQVEYIEQRPEMKLENIPTIFFKKAKEWGYEQEFRVLTKQGNCCFNFSQTALTGMILGAKMSNETKEQIIGIIENNKLDLNIYQAETSLNTFKIEFNRIQ